MANFACSETVRPTRYGCQKRNTRYICISIICGFAREKLKASTLLQLVVNIKKKKEKFLISLFLFIISTFFLSSLVIYIRLTNGVSSQVIKSKSEVSALTEFLSWLESVKGNTDGVILVYHEPRKVIPAMLLESLKKYDLVDRFKQTVKGFANGFNIAEEKCANSAHIYSLRTLSRTLLKKVRKTITIISQ